MDPEFQHLKKNVPFCNYNRGDIVYVLQTQTPYKVHRQVFHIIPDEKCTIS